MIKYIISSLAFAVLLASSLLITPASAQTYNPFKDACTSRTGDSSVCRDSQGPADVNNNRIVGPNGVLTKAVGLLSVLVGIAAVIVIIISGIRMIVSAGDSKSVVAARNGILYAVIGLLIALLAQAIVIFVLRRV